MGLTQSQPTQPLQAPGSNQFKQVEVIPGANVQPTNLTPGSKAPIAQAPAAVDSGPVPAPAPQAPTGFQSPAVTRDPNGFLNPNTGLRELGGPLPGTRAFEQNNRIAALEEFLKGRK